jgi:hypothetical protein
MTFRGDQIQTIGGNMGKFQEGDLIEICLDAMTNLGASVAEYREDLSNRVQRYIRIEEREDESGYLELEVRFTNWREPERRFRVQLVITEQEPS